MATGPRAEIPLLSDWNGTKEPLPNAGSVEDDRPAIGYCQSHQVLEAGLPRLKLSLVFVVVVARFPLPIPNLPVVLFCSQPTACGIEPLGDPKESGCC